MLGVRLEEDITYEMAYLAEVTLRLASKIFQKSLVELSSLAELYKIVPRYADDKKVSNFLTNVTKYRLNSYYSLDSNSINTKPRISDSIGSKINVPEDKKSPLKNHTLAQKIFYPNSIETKKLPEELGDEETLMKENTFSTLHSKDKVPKVQGESRLRKKEDLDRIFSDQYPNKESKDEREMRELTKAVLSETTTKTSSFSRKRRTVNDYSDTYRDSARYSEDYGDDYFSTNDQMADEEADRNSEVPSEGKPLKAHERSYYSPDKANYQPVISANGLPEDNLPQVPKTEDSFSEVFPRVGIENSRPVINDQLWQHQRQISNADYSEQPSYFGSQQYEPYPHLHAASQRTQHSLHIESGNQAGPQSVPNEDYDEPVSVVDFNDHFFQNPGYDSNQQQSPSTENIPSQRKLLSFGYIPNQRRKYIGYIPNQQKNRNFGYIPNRQRKQNVGYIPSQQKRKTRYNPLHLAHEFQKKPYVHNTIHNGLKATYLTKSGEPATFPVTPDDPDKGIAGVKILTYDPAKLYADDGSSQTTSYASKSSPVIDEASKRPPRDFSSLPQTSSPLINLAHPTFTSRTPVSLLKEWNITYMNRAPCPGPSRLQVFKALLNAFKTNYEYSGFYYPHQLYKSVLNETTHEPIPRNYNTFPEEYIYDVKC